MGSPHQEAPPTPKPYGQLTFRSPSVTGFRNCWDRLSEVRRRDHLVKSCPGLAPVRAAELLPIVVTPYRFQSKRGFWSYCGLGVATLSSSDWVRTQTGEWMKAEVKRTRGLNRNLGHTLKAIFKGAATTVIGRAEDDPIYRHYLGLLDGGTKPNLAKPTIARQIASIVLAVWRTKEVYDPKRLEEASKKS